MNHDEVIAKLEELRKVMEQYNGKMYESSDEAKALHGRLVSLYGEVADVIEQFEGRAEIVIPGGHGTKSVFPNYIEAGYLSGRTMHTHQGYTQLLKVIGKVRAQASRMPRPRDESSVSLLLRILGRFRECCQYLREPPADERAVQDVVWIMLRSQFDRVDREGTLPKFGLKSYRPDFGVPEVRTLVEVKFIGDKTDPARTQDELLADVPAYLTNQSAYDGIVIVVYDAAHKLRDPVPFVEDLRRVEGVLDVIVVPGIG